METLWNSKIDCRLRKPPILAEKDKYRPIVACRMHLPIAQ